MPQGRTVIEVQRCKGCTLCTTACPQHIILMAEEKLNALGYHPATVVDPEGKCTGCALCAVICPDACITVYRIVGAAKEKVASLLKRSRKKGKAMTQELLKGNEAIAEAAIRAGLDAYFGYPITPQTEILEHVAKRMPELGRVFLQAESEVAAINMVYGAACTGARVMTTSSSPGISLMMEGISYIMGSEVPCVIVDVMRGGPGLGNIAPAQGDYFQIVKGGGHGDYQPIVLAPATVQEAIDQTCLAFDLAEKYRTLAFVLLDGSLGQMMEPGELPPMRPLKKERPPWPLSGAQGRPRNIVTSIYIQPELGEAFNLKLQKKFKEIQQHEVRYYEYQVDDAEYIVVGFGTAGRIAQTAVKQARAQGIKIGLHRPLTLFPFPEQRLGELAQKARAMLVVEMNAGQMLQDVRLAANGRIPIEFYGRMGGIVPFPDEVSEAIQRLVKTYAA